MRVLNASKPGRPRQRPYEVELSIKLFESVQFAHKVTRLIFLALDELDLKGRVKRISHPEIRKAVFVIIDRLLAHLESEFRRKCAKTLNTELLN